MCVWNQNGKPLFSPARMQNLLLRDAKWTQLWAIGVENDPWGGKVDFVARWHARVTGQGAEKRSSVSQGRAGMGSQTLVFPQRGSFFQRGNENEKK